MEHCVFEMYRRTVKQVRNPHASSRGSSFVDAGKLVKIYYCWRIKAQTTL